jgi:hypothetical protein
MNDKRQAFLVMYCLKENKTNYKVLHFSPVNSNPSTLPVAVYLPMCVRDHTPLAEDWYRTEKQGTSRDQSPKLQFPSQSKELTRGPPELVWLNLSPIPVGRRGVISSLKWFLPFFATRRGGGSRRPVGLIYRNAEWIVPRCMRWIYVLRSSILCKYCLYRGLMVLKIFFYALFRLNL